jgi:hypothetical protein
MQTAAASSFFMAPYSNIDVLKKFYRNVFYIFVGEIWV